LMDSSQMPIIDRFFVAVGPREYERNRARAQGGIPDGLCLILGIWDQENLLGADNVFWLVKLGYDRK
jgi:hypothetical protein